MFGAKTRADIIGLQEVRRLTDNRAGTTPPGGKYTLFHTACEVLPSGAPNLGVGLLIRTYYQIVEPEAPHREISRCATEFHDICGSCATFGGFFR